MHLLLIHQAYASPDEAGGTRHYELARHLVDRGHSVTIVASSRSYLTGKSVVERNRPIVEQDLDGIRILRVNTYAPLHRSFFWRVISFLSFMLISTIAALRVGGVDVVMGTSPPIFQALSAWTVATLRRRPFLLEIRDLWPEFAIDMGVLENPALIALARSLERFLYARATHLLVNSPGYREYLLGKNLAPAKVSLIPNGVHPDMFDPSRSGLEMRRRLGLDSKFICLYAGALGLANDIPTVLHAANHLSRHEDIHIVLVGDGKERMSLEAEARKLALTNVTFVGARPKSEMPEMLAASDVCLATLKDIPMFRTTYPNKVFDYMAAGRPTIYAIDGVIREVLEAACGGIYTPPGNDGALAEAILMLYRDRAVAKEMGADARAYVVEHFDRRRQAQAFEHLLHRLIRCGR